jgi:hypothetical protein
LLFFSSITQLKSQAIINEWSQGPAGGTSEWIEILVTQCPTADLRGWRVDEETPAVTPLFVFSNDACWANVPCGTIIVVYNQNSTTGRDPVLPPDENDCADCNFRLIVNAANATFFSTNNWSSSVALSNTTVTDNPILKDAFGITVHDWDQGNLAAFTGAALRPGSNRAVYYTGNTAAGVANAANWIRDFSNATAITPGAPNGGINTTWILSLRATHTSVITLPATDTAVCSPANFAVTASNPSDWTLKKGDGSPATSEGISTVTSNVLSFINTTAVNRVDTVFSQRPFGCRDTLLITVRPKPAIQSPTSTNDTTVCSGANFGFTSLVSGNWQHKQGQTGLTTAAGTGFASTVINFINTTGVAVNDTIFINAGGCLDTIRVTVLPSGQIQSPTSANDTTVCSGSVFGFTSPLSGNWTHKNAAGVITGIGTGVTNSTTVNFINTTTLSVNDSIFVVYTNGCRDTLRVTVLPEVKISSPTSTNDTSVCSGSTFAFTVPISGDWTYSEGGLPPVVIGTAQIVSNPVNFINTSGIPRNDSIFVTVSGCRDTIRVTVNPIPAAPFLASATPTNCAGVAATINASGGGLSAIYQWFNTSVGGAPFFVGNQLITTPLSNDTTFWVEVVENGCTSFTRTSIFIDIINPGVVPANTIYGCAGQRVTVPATGGSITSQYVWYQSPTGGTPFHSGFTYTTAPLTGDTTFYVAIVESGCTSTVRGTLFVDLVANPPAPVINGTTAICPGNRTTLTASGAGPTAEYRWYKNVGSTTPFFVGSSYTTGILTADTTFFVEAILLSDCPPSLRTAVTVSMLPIPAPPSISAAPILCPGGSTTLIAVPPAGGTALWFQNQSSITAFATGNSYTTTNLLVDSIYWAASVVNGCTSSTRSSYQVIMGPPPPPPVVSSITTLPICSGNTALLQATSIYGGSFLWYRESTGGIPFFEGTQYTTGILTNDTVLWVAQYVGGCTSVVRSSILVAVNATPIAPIDTFRTCPANQVTINITPNSIYAYYVWYTNQTGGVKFFTGNTYVTSVLTADTTYWVETVENGCTSFTRTAIPVKIVNNAPEPVITSLIQTCPGVPVVITPSGGGPGATYAWYRNSTGLTDRFYIGTNYTTSALVVDSTYWVETIIGSCTSATRVPVTVQVKPVPVAPFVDVITPATCAGTTALIGASGAGVGATYLWYDSDNPSAVPFFNGSLYTTAPVFKDTILWVASVLNGCTSLTRNSVLVTATGSILPPFRSGSIISCPGNTVTLKPNYGSSSVLFGFYSDATGGTPFYVGSSYTTIPLAADTTIWVATIAGNCTSTGRTPYYIDLVPFLPGPEVEPSVGICKGQRATLKVKTVLGTVAAWFKDNDRSAPFFIGNPYVTSVLSQDTVVWVSTWANGCQSALRVPIRINVEEAPVIPAFTKRYVACEGTSILLAPDTILPHTQYEWYDRPLSATPFFVGNAYLLPLVNRDSITFYVATNRYGCVSPNRAPVVVRMEKAPKAPILAGSSSVCSGERASVSIPVNPLETYLWYTNENVATPFFTGNNYVTSVLTNDTVLWVRSVAAGCTSISVSRLDIFLKTTPVAPKPFEISLCYGSKGYITIRDSVNGYRYRWYRDSIGGSAPDQFSVFETPTVTDQQIYWVSATQFGCESNQRAKVVVNPSVLAMPIIDSVRSERFICAGSPAILYASAISGTNEWYADTLLLKSIQKYDTLRTDPLENDTVFYVRADDGKCRSYFVPVAVKIVPRPLGTQILGKDTVGLLELMELRGVSSNDPNTKYDWDFGAAGMPKVATGAGAHTIAFKTTGLQSITLTARSGNCVERVVKTVWVGAATTGIGAGLEEDNSFVILLSLIHI